MKLTKTMCAMALGSIGVMQSLSAHAWDLSNGDSLTITAGTYAFDAYDNYAGISSGSFFAVDIDDDSNIDNTEKIALSQGSTGIVIGAPNTAPGEITAPWTFLGNTGYDWVSATPVTGGTDGINMSGWMVTWNFNQIDLGTGAWQVLNASSGMPTSGYANGVGIFNWSGTYGDSYTLDYTATPQDGPFIGVQWALHLEGTVAPVPEASTYAMMLAGLGLVGIAAGRGRTQA